MPKGQDTSKAVRVLAAAYALFGALWIVVSDNVLAVLFPGSRAITVAQTWKGWAFVAISALLILWLGRRLLGALDQSERRYRKLFADSPVPMLVYGASDGVIAEANPAAGRLLGATPAELAGLPVTGLVASEERADACLLLGVTADRDGSVTTTRTLQCRDGRRIHTLIQGETVEWEGRRMRLAALTDITASLKAEAALIGTLDRLARQEAERAQLAHALAHDLREPVRQVVGFIQLLDRRYRDRIDDEADQWIAFATEGAHRLNTLLTDAQAFTATPAWRSEPVDVADVVAEVVATLAAELDSGGARLCVGEMPTIRADRQNLAVVLTILVGNAVKFRHPDRRCRIHLRCERAGSDWRFSVQDNGSGIEPEYAESVFALFRRLHTRDRIPGNGTGLAMARKLVEAAGGSIWLDTGVAEGTLMHFTLPVPDPARAT